ncbi:hypothetical protein QQF64_003376 [Cirrhinus molitorella]|uniref:Uncharacterized protein n=1 Tax=Cirrhinus molitorella TaxID=172907 RepID=A0ABR3ML39_9TELE
MISDVSSSTSFMDAACPSRLGISTLPSSRTFPAWSFLSAVTIAAFGMGWVMLGLSRICNRLRMCLFTASSKSTSTRVAPSVWLSPQDAQLGLMLEVSVSGAGVQRMETRMDTKQSTSNTKLFIFWDNKRLFPSGYETGLMEMKAAKFVSASFHLKKVT